MSDQWYDRVSRQFTEQQLAEAQAEIATLRAENTHLKLALALVESLRNKEKGFNQ